MWYAQRLREPAKNACARLARERAAALSQRKLPAADPPGAGARGPRIIFPARLPFFRGSVGPRGGSRGLPSAVAAMDGSDEAIVKRIREMHAQGMHGVEYQDPSFPATDDTLPPAVREAVPRRHATPRPSTAAHRGRRVASAAPSLGPPFCFCRPAA